MFAFFAMDCLAVLTARRRAVVRDVLVYGGMAVGLGGGKVKKS